MDSDLLSALVGLVSGVVGGVAGVLVGMVLQQRDHRARLTFDLHAEFNNGEFARVRSRAAHTLRTNPEITFEVLNEKLPDEAPDVWLVVRFYEKLWVAVEYGYIQRNMVPDLFGSIFFWWYIRHYRTKLVHINYASSARIKKLYKWLCDFADKPEIQKWETRAQFD